MIFTCNHVCKLGLTKTDCTPRACNVIVLPLIISYSVLTIWVSVFCQRRFVCQNRARGAICPLRFPAPETGQLLPAVLLAPVRSEVARLGRGQRSRIAAKKIKKRFGITGHCPTDTSTRKEHSLGSQVSVWLTQASNKIHYVCNNRSVSGGHRLQIMYSVWDHRSLVGTVCKKKKTQFALRGHCPLSAKICILFGITG